MQINSNYALISSVLCLLFFISSKIHFIRCRSSEVEVILVMELMMIKICSGGERK